MNRRDVLKLSGGAALGLAAAPVLAGSVREPTSMLALFDARFAASRAFAQAARRSGARAVATEGDIPSLWHGALRGAPLARLAGVTTYADMVAIAALAGEARQSFALQIAHVMQGDAVEHRLVEGPAGALKLLAAAGAEWPEGCWSLAAREVRPSGGATPRAHAPGATLWSWAIA